MEAVAVRCIEQNRRSKGYARYDHFFWLPHKLKILPPDAEKTAEPPALPRVASEAWSAPAEAARRVGTNEGFFTKSGPKGPKSGSFR